MNQGGIPEYLYLKPKIFHSEFEKNYLQDTVRKNKNLKYIVVRKDIVFHHKIPSVNELTEDYKFISKNKIEKIIGDFEIYKSNYYDPVIKACNKSNCLVLKNTQINELTTNIYFIKNLEEFLPKHFVINDLTLKTLVLPKIIKNIFNIEISYIAYDFFQFYLLMGWFFQIILIILCFYIQNLKIKNIYVRK
jgi:hypothetical protein